MTKAMGIFLKRNENFYSNERCDGNISAPSIRKNYEELHLPCLLSSVGTGCIPNPTVFLIGSMRVRAVFNNCLAVGTPDP